MRGPVEPHPRGGELDVDWSGPKGLGTGIVVGRSAAEQSALEEDDGRLRARSYQRMWTDDSMGDAERMLVATGLQIERMSLLGLDYIRIWSMHAPSRGSGGGGLDLPPEAIEHLASAATSIHIRLAGGSGGDLYSLTLKPGVAWPLQQLQRGLPFDRTLHGVDVTPAIARVTWAGDPQMLDAMWTKGVNSTRGVPEDVGESLRQGGRLYAAVGNPNGLFLVAGKRCELPAGTPARVEVWLGKVQSRR